jgi:hypothetical protein
MATMGCREFLDQLDSWMEGGQRPDARAHLSGCPDCRGIAEDLGAITTVAHSMAEEAEPPGHLWNSIRAQLEQEGMIREPRGAEIAAPRNSRFAWFALPKYALTGVSLVALVTAGVALRGPLTRRMNDYRWMRGTQDSTSSLSASLDSVEHATVASISSNPAVAAALHKNLDIVDNYITLCEKSVREDPQSEMARDFLYDAYQQKANLLAQMNEQGE